MELQSAIKSDEVSSIVDSVMAHLPKDRSSKIVVAMSGGVDSSVVAAVLKDLRYDVIGVTLQLYDHGFAVGRKGACCAGKDIYDAQEVARKVQIPHYVFNYERRFKDEVIIPFVDSYLAGETPIPCILCNQKIKFRDLMQASIDLKADYMATGHYVQKIHNLSTNRDELHRALDHSKDQSYFMYTMTQNQLNRSIFPLGGISKEATRILASHYGLDVHDKSDSQDICFVPDGNYANVILKIADNLPKDGDIVDLDGNILGRHNGIIHYTVGQRKGLNLMSRIDNTKPLYVVKIDAKKNQIIVGEQENLMSSYFYVRDISWLAWDILPSNNSLNERHTKNEQINEDERHIANIDDHSRGIYDCNSSASGKDLNSKKSIIEKDIAMSEIDLASLDGVECQAKVRSGSRLINVKLQFDHSKSSKDEALIKVVVDGQYSGIAPGQACVFYRNDRLLGGGWIAKESVVY